MNVFVPPGCVSCSDALHKLLTTKYGGNAGIAAHWWASALTPHSRQAHLLNAKNAKRLKETLLVLQNELCAGERTACYVYGNDLVNLEPGAFLNESATHSISIGKIVPDGWSPTAASVPLFIRKDGYQLASPEVEDAPIAESLPEPAGAPPSSKGGAPVRGRDAAIIYCVLYPNGHSATGIQWPSALVKVNACLTAMHLEAVSSKKTVIKYVKELKPDLFGADTEK